jgi:CRP-like cAMP-binding protein
MSNRTSNDMHRANDQARAEYNRILGGAIADAIDLDSRMPIGMPGGPIDPESEHGRCIKRLSALLGGFSPADIAEALDLAAQLRAYPGERAQWLERLGDAVGRVPSFEPLASACFANAAGMFDSIGDPAAQQRCASKMLSFERDEVWLSYARKMVARDGARPGGNLGSIAQCAMYDKLSEAARSELIKIAGVPHKYPKGDYLCVEGLRADKAFFLKSGRVAILQEVERAEKFLRFRHPGEVIGDMGLLAENRRRTASCLAVEHTEAWVIGYKELETLLHDHTDFRQLLDHQFVERRVETRLLQHPVTARLDIAERVRLADMLDTSLGTAMRLAPQQQLVHRAAAVDHVYLLLDGTVELISPLREDSEATFTTSDKRAFFLGLPALFGAVSWPVDVVAKTSGWVARFPVAGLREFASSRSVLRDAVAEVLIASATGRAIVA